MHGAYGDVIHPHDPNTANRQPVATKWLFVEVFISVPFSILIIEGLFYR